MVCFMSTFFRGAFKVGAIALLYGLLVQMMPATASDSNLRRVIVSTDIGGSDPDDFQSMVHLLLLANEFELKAIISSPWGEGRKQDILDVINLYDKDYDRLSSCDETYPVPDYLRSITKQGATEMASYQGYSQPTEGSEAIIAEARKDDDRPLFVLVWGGIEDLAQALHDAPDILPKLRVYFIGGPNKKWSPHAYTYILNNHPDLWIIEANSTYRGWFVGGDQTGDLGNKSFVTEHVAGKGALGDFFVTKLGGVIKMGDTPAVVWLLHDDPLTPTKPGWGGHFVRAWKRGHFTSEGLTTRSDVIERYGIFELVLGVEDTAGASDKAWLEIDNQKLPGYFDGTFMRFRFSPKNPMVYGYKVSSTLASLDGLEGEISVRQLEDNLEPDTSRPNWWTDNPAPELMDEGFHGTKTVNIWRQAFLSDFAQRLKQCHQ